MKTRLLFTHALSPLHPGTGQGVGVIDLPVAREKATGLPYLPGSSLKGALRDQCTDAAVCKQVFGPETRNASDHAGAAIFSDQRLLLLPVRSLVGTFAWVTSPFVLQRFLRDAREASVKALDAVPGSVTGSAALVTSNSQLLHGSNIYLEDLDLTAGNSNGVDSLAKWLGSALFPDSEEWQTSLVQRLTVVSDDVLSFLLETATEVTARIKLQDDKKTVEKGGLWYEESLPAETVLSGLVLATGVGASGATPDQVMKVVSSLMDKSIQLGGKATVGRGLCRLRLVQEG